MPLLTMTKHHGLGNDFLVLLDPDRAIADDASALARHACDRRRGIGADGLILARRGGGDVDVAMELRNADGGRAEMSGNGIRCLAQAVRTAGWVRGNRVRVATDVGVRVVECEAGDGPVMQARVDMGAVTDAGDASRFVHGAVRHAALLDVGNPHLVLLSDPPLATIDVADEAQRIGVEFPDGINIEWIAPAVPGEIDLRVWERGAGETQACGTGSCAAASAAQVWGLVGWSVVVHNPGGAVTVVLRDGRAELTGPAELVARVEMPWR